MAVISIRGFLVELLLLIDPDLYGPFVTTDKKGEKVMVVQCMNAIYGTMVANLLYKKIVKTLKSTRFQLNPYDPCVANFPMNNKQQTICFHVDD